MSLDSDIKKHFNSFSEFLSENTIWSWMTIILLVIIFATFLIHPIISNILGTDTVFIVVISESMEHQETFEGWWNSPATCSINNLTNECTQKDWYSYSGISETDFRTFPFKDGLHKGDLLILKGTNFTDLNVGDVFVYKSGKGLIVHRTVAKDFDSKIIETKGDRNKDQLNIKSMEEKFVSESDIVGKPFYRISYIGYIRIWFASFVDWFL